MEKKEEKFLRRKWEEDPWKFINNTLEEDNNKVKGLIRDYFRCD